MQLLLSEQHTTVEIEIDGRWQIQQVLGATGQAQNPSLFHFGLGATNKTGAVCQELGMSEPQQNSYVYSWRKSYCFG